MKSVQVGQSSLLQAPATPHVHLRTRSNGAVTVGMATDAVLVAVIAAILALYAAMVLGLYRWSRYDPLLPPASVTVAYASTETNVGPADYAGLENVLPSFLKSIAPSLSCTRAALSSM